MINLMIMRHSRVPILGFIAMYKFGKEIKFNMHY